MNAQKMYHCLDDKGEHGSLHEASNCCGSEEELWECDECGNIYDDEGQAEDCCTEGES